jgi:hypothetical protein
MRLITATLGTLGMCLALSNCSSAKEAPAQSSAPAAAPAAATGGTLRAGWTVTDGIETPESAYIDTSSGFIYVSQIAGAPDARDGNGRIVKLRGDGTVVSTSFTTGLNAPKGLRACGGLLWAADLGEAVGIDMTTGQVSSRVMLPSAQFPNDTACGSDGTVYISDMMASRIYAVQGGTASVFAEGDDLEWPNGLLVEGDHLVVGGWGKPAADLSTKVPGRLFTINLQTKKKTLITPQPFANIDGVESDGRGGYIITDWQKGQILHVAASGEVRLLQQLASGTADLAFMSASNIAIVPHMAENKVVAYDVSDALK